MPPPWLPESANLCIPVDSGVADSEIPDEHADLRYVLEEGYRRPIRPLSARLPFHYHRIPPRLRRSLARFSLFRRRPAPFPRCPFEPSVDAVRWARGERFRWPAGRRYVVLLTHDVDTERGLALIPTFAELERALGVRSSFFVCSHHYPLDIELLSRLESEGFEVASHGYNHDNRIAFLSQREREARLRKIVGRFRPEVPLLGFRSPSLGRTPDLFQSLAGQFIYDSSVPDVDLEGGGGCATVLPYYIGKLLEIPITLPMESSLLYLEVRPREIFERWKEKLAWIQRVGGVATAVLHTEPQLGGHPELRGLYAEWIACLGSDAWITTPRELARHIGANFLSSELGGGGEFRPDGRAAQERKNHDPVRRSCCSA